MAGTQQNFSRPTTDSRLAALARIQAALNAGVVDPQKMQGGCQYQLGRFRCAVGCLFNQRQLLDIQQRGLNNRGVTILRDRIGQQNLEAVTGLTVQDLIRIQGSHDEATWHEEPTAVFGRRLQSMMEEIRDRAPNNC